MECDNQFSKNLFQNESKVLESQDITEEELKIMKGDTIGETLYSSQWIINTLISLSNIYEDGWTETMENNLCTLWDMSTEKDIINFLLENDFLKLCKFILKSNNIPRLMEIIIGIIGNMCCDTKCINILPEDNELVTKILSFISLDDKETLIQILRILQAAVWDIQKNPQSLWLKKINECKILGESICFILKSSTSDELLTYTIELVYLLSDIEGSTRSDLISDIFNVEELIFAVCESITELLQHENNFDTQNNLKNIEKWLSIMFNIITKNLLKFSDSRNDEKFQKINTLIIKILKPYENPRNITLLEERRLICIQECVKMVLIFQNNEMIPNTELIKIILKIIINLKSVAVKSEFEDYSALEKMHKFLTNYWIETIKIIDKEQLIDVLKLCDQKTVNNTIEITKSLMTDPKNSVNNILELMSNISFE